MRAAKARIPRRHLDECSLIDATNIHGFVNKLELKVCACYPIPELELDCFGSGARCDSGDNSGA